MSSVLKPIDIPKETGREEAREESVARARQILEECPGGTGYRQHRVTEGSVRVVANGISAVVAMPILHPAPPRGIGSMPFL